MVFTFALLGNLLIQAAWALVVPPFRGLDEHDHAFKAAAVAHGDWGWRHEASPLGWGEMLTAPRDLVVAAGPECSDLPYTTTDNCLPGEERGGDLVLVASSASRYNPVFYAVVGLPTLALDGVAALYAMRAAAAILCAALIAGAAVVIRRWSTTGWPATAMLLAMTPVFTYSTSVVAPNGVELAGALLLWAALAGYGRGRDEAFAPKLMLTVATLAAIPLTGVRALGPLWLALIVITACVIRPSLIRLLLATRSGWISTTVVVVTAVASAGWTLIAGTNSPEATTGEFGRPSFSDMAGSATLWLLQSIAAFPARDELAPLSLYAIALVAWWLLGALAFRVASRRLRIVSFAALLVTLAVPVAITLATFDTLGSVWQGRYGYPFAIGIILLGGLALDRAVTGPRLVPVVVAGAVMATIQVIGQLGVLSKELANSPQAGTSAWPAPSIWFVVLLTTAGSALFCCAFLRLREFNVDQGNRHAVSPVRHGSR